MLIFNGFFPRYNLFSSLRIYVNATEICQVKNYNIFAYLNTKMAATKQDKSTHLINNLWIEDDLEKMDICDSSNSGYMKRREVLETKFRLMLRQSRQLRPTMLMTQKTMFFVEFCIVQYQT